MYIKKTLFFYYSLLNILSFSTSLIPIDTEFYKNLFKRPKGLQLEVGYDGELFHRGYLN